MLNDLGYKSISFAYIDPIRKRDNAIEARQRFQNSWQSSHVAALHTRTYAEYLIEIYATDEIYRDHCKKPADCQSTNAENPAQIFTHRASTRKLHLSIVCKVIDKTFSSGF